MKKSKKNITLSRTLLTLVVSYAVFYFLLSVAFNVFWNPSLSPWEDDSYLNPAVGFAGSASIFLGSFFIVLSVGFVLHYIMVRI